MFWRLINFVALPAIVKTILKINNLQRAPNQAGQINQVEQSFVNADGILFQFPTKMTLQFIN